MSGEGNVNPLQYSCLENPMDRGAWWATVHEVSRVGHNLATKPPPPTYVQFDLFCHICILEDVGLSEQRITTLTSRG